ncbi:MAG TPA: RluA family pseudouridine synthase [Isosphaeraceae bacterium]|nr:RluA family pseudouridine synthase [Isosphaeraceae bacterium]
MLGPLLFSGHSACIGKGERKRMAIRLDKLVAERFGLSRRGAQEAIRNGRIDLAGARCDEPGREVEANVALEFFPSRPRARKVRSRLAVLYEDPHLLIVDKPAGLLTLPTAQHEHDTLLERATRFLALRYGGRPYVGIVHRIDKDTSGALILARSPGVQRALQALLKAHDVERRYVALVEGTVVRQSGTIRLALVTDRGDLRRGVAREPGEGRKAVTHFRVLERFGSVATLLECWLETGRTHQIRIHLAAQGHPVVGERVYRPRSLGAPKVSFHRQALHAQTLGFRHPITGAMVHAEAPLPHDFEQLLAEVRQRVAGRRSGGWRGRT